MKNTNFDHLPDDTDGAADAAFKVLIHPGSLLLDTATTAKLSWIAERGAADDADRRLLRDCRDLLLRAERSVA